MALTPESIRKIATLARLRFTPEEEGVLARQLGRIVDYIDQLERFETGESDPAAALSRGQPVREADDLPRPGLPREAFLANAPASALGEFLVVPEVKGGSDDAS
jgi:aspartyl-tRNA(Asn)/glutamyl-tRNA(Gln) amidotransferase subunit C